MVHSWRWYHPMGFMACRMGFWWLCSHRQLTSSLSVSVPVRGQGGALCSGLSVIQAFPSCSSDHTVNWSWRVVIWCWSTCVVGLAQGCAGLAEGSPQSVAE